jgi:tetratricopeptide (TPR) repeat protein
MMDRSASAITLLLVAVMVAMVSGFAQRPQFAYQSPAEKKMADAAADPKGHAQQYRQMQIDERFQQAIAMLHAKQYDFAIKALHRVIELAPQMPEAYVNMGFALIGKENYKAAADFFNSAIEIRPYQANAYWGLAISLEQLGDLEGALGAMRTFIHLSPPNDPFVRKARSALWEWESTLKRGPLPEDEKEWIERNSKEWVERNGPEADSPAAVDQQIPLKH